MYGRDKGYSCGHKWGTCHNQGKHRYVFVAPEPYLILFSFHLRSLCVPLTSKIKPSACGQRPTLSFHTLSVLQEPVPCRVPGWGFGLGLGVWYFSIVDCESVCDYTVPMSLLGRGRLLHHKRRAIPTTWQVYISVCLFEC